MKNRFTKHDISFINELTQFFTKQNWKTFDVFTFQIDRDYVSNDITIDFIVLGLGLHYYHNFNN